MVVIDLGIDGVVAIATARQRPMMPAIAQVRMTRCPTLWRGRPGLDVGFGTTLSSVRTRTHLPARAAAPLRKDR